MRATVAFDIGAEDCDELTFKVLGAMLVSPSSVREGKLTNAVSLSLAWTGQIQRCDRWRMRWDEKIELVSE